MAKSRKKPAASEVPIELHIGDKVNIPRATSVLEISLVHHGGDEVGLQLPGTNLQWFRIKADTLTYVDRKLPEPVFDAGELLERIETGSARQSKAVRR